VISYNTLWTKCVNSDISQPPQSQGRSSWISHWAINKTRSTRSNILKTKTKQFQQLVSNQPLVSTKPNQATVKDKRCIQCQRHSTTVAFSEAWIVRAPHQWAPANTALKVIIQPVIYFKEIRKLHNVQRHYPLIKTRTIRNRSDIQKYIRSDIDRCKSL